MQLLCGLAGPGQCEAMRGPNKAWLSIHGTLNHLLVGDEIWMGRFTDRAFAVDGLNSELYSYFNALKAARVAMDERIEAWAARLTDQLLKGRLGACAVGTRMG